MQDNPGRPEGCSGELFQGVQRYLLMPVHLRSKESREVHKDETYNIGNRKCKGDEML